jgi:hypothetical protein
MRGDRSLDTEGQEQYVKLPYGNFGCHA